MNAEWAELTPDQKRTARIQRWLSPPGVSFSSPEAEKSYKERVTRLAKAMQIQEPDRVPCVLPAGFYAAKYAGGNLRKVMYDFEELKRAWTLFMEDFDTDASLGANMVPPGRALDITDYKAYKWPGHGVGENTLSYQAVEGEWMKPDEYDIFINDPSDFWLRVYLPRIFGSLAGFTQFPALRSFEEISMISFAPFGSPEVRKGLEALIQAGKDGALQAQAVGAVNQLQTALGYPGLAGGLAKAPFDTVGDTLRGTQGIMMDMFQRPDKIFAAMERIVPLTIQSAIGMSNGSGVPIVLMPLHKGADAFMSVKQYEKFYWPTFKRVVDALIEEGIVPILFAEGSYNKRFDFMKDFPKGSVIWYLDQTDIVAAKQAMGDTCCLMGNVPTSLLMTGTPQQVKEHCRKLIEACAAGGGYILNGGANIDEGNPENLRVMMEAAKEYGVYS